MMKRSTLIRLAVIFSTAVLIFTGCSRFGIAYQTADLLAQGYAKSYLDLEQAQLARWEPTLQTELDRHRDEELPYLAAYFDQLLSASQSGFDEGNTSCLAREFKQLYQRQAQSAATLAAPLLADLTPSQIQALKSRFDQEAAEDGANIAKRSAEQESRKRARRYVKAIENWTGPLTEAQKQIVAEVSSQIPDTRTGVHEYRTRKREQLIALLDAKTDSAAIEGFLSAWLVEFRDLPQDLERGTRETETQLVELLVRLDQTFDEGQRKRLNERFRDLRDEFMRLQNEPRMAPASC